MPAILLPSLNKILVKKEKRKRKDIVIKHLELWDISELIFLDLDLN